MFTWIINKIKAFGVTTAISSLDNLKAPLGDQFQKSIDEFGKLDGKGAAILIIDEVKKYLYEYFQIEPPTEEKK